METPVVGRVKKVATTLCSKIRRRRSQVGYGEDLDSPIQMSAPGGRNHDSVHGNIGETDQEQPGRELDLGSSESSAERFASNSVLTEDEEEADGNLEPLSEAHWPLALDKLSERAKRFSFSRALVPSRKRDSMKEKENDKEESIANMMERTGIAEETGDLSSGSRGRSLADLPFDILFNVMTFSEISSVVSLSHTCRAFHAISESSTLWINLTIQLQRRSRILALDDLVHPYSLHSDQSSLRRMVLRTEFLERNWASKNPRIVTHHRPHPGQIRSNSHRSRIVHLDYNMTCTLYAGSFYISEQFLILSTIYGHLIGWDISNASETDDTGRLTAHKLGMYNMGEPYGLTLLRMSHTERCLYAVTCKVDDDESRLLYRVVRIQLPAASYEGCKEDRKMDGQVIASFSVPKFWQIKTHDINYKRKCICMLYQVPFDDTLRVFFLFDWDTFEHVDFDSSHINVLKGSGLGIRLSDDYESLRVYVMTGSLWVQKTFSMSSIVNLHCLATRQESLNNKPRTAAAFNLPSPAFVINVSPIRVFSNELELPPFAKEVGEGIVELYQYWNLSQWWLRYNFPEHGIDVPTRFSRIFFYYIHPHVLGDPAEDALVLGEQLKKVWYVVQHYTSSEGPLSRKMFVCPLYDCPTIRLGALGFPIMGASFNHIAWIENTTVTELMECEEPQEPETQTSILNRWKGKRDVPVRMVERTRTKRVLRLLSFPEPGVAPASDFDIRELPERSARMRGLEDVPETVLDKAIHIFLEPALGAVLITTSDNEMHRFDYA